MPLAMVFWMIWIICVVFGILSWIPATSAWGPRGQGLVALVLFFLLGLGIFGKVIK